jgi:hypothetical protein
VKGDVFKRGKTFGVSESHVFVADIAGDPRNICSISQAGLNWRIDNFEYTFTGRAARLDELIELVQSPDWLIEESRQHQKCNEVAELHRTAQHHLGPNRNDEHNS